MFAFIHSLFWSIKAHNYFSLFFQVLTRYLFGLDQLEKSPPYTDYESEMSESKQNYMKYCGQLKYSNIMPFSLCSMIFLTRTLLYCILFFLDMFLNNVD